MYREFIQKHNLSLVAGNFVQAEWDEYVLELQKQQQLRHFNKLWIIYLFYLYTTNLK